MLNNSKLIDFKTYPVEIMLMQSRIKTQTFSKTELENLSELQDFLNKNSCELVFTDDYYEGEAYYTLDMIKNSYKKINNIVSEIKNLNLSPAEQYIYACLKIAEKPYNEFDWSCLTYNELLEIKNKFKCKSLTQNLSRSVNGVLNTDFIVCAGYSFLLQSVCRELGIKCYTQGAVCKSMADDKRYLHRFNFVNIVDEKYKLNTWAITDLTRLNGKDYKDNKYINLNYFLLPINDLNKQKHNMYYFYELAGNNYEKAYSPLNLIYSGFNCSNPQVKAFLKNTSLKNFDINVSQNTTGKLNYRERNEILVNRTDKKYSNFINTLKNNCKPINHLFISNLYVKALKLMNYSEKEITELLVKNYNFSIDYAYLAFKNASNGFYKEAMQLVNEQEK